MRDYLNQKNEANPEHVELANKGSAAIEEWRKSNPYQEEERSPGLWLSGAELGGRDLEGADLRGARLDKTNFGTQEYNPNILSGLTPNRNEQLEWAAEASQWTNLRGADFTGARLQGANFTRADMQQANLTEVSASEANFHTADLTGAKLVKTNFSGADLTGTCLEQADLREARLIGADLRGAILSNADLTGSDLSAAILTGARLEGTILRGSRVYGAAVWDIIGTPEDQRDLIITRDSESPLTVDKLEFAQLLYLIMNNKKIRDMIDTLISKAVLILGRFTKDRKAVLDALRSELRNHDLTPIVFDFDGPSSKDTTGTVETLARMARFIVADLTDPSSIPHELATIIPFLRTTPVVPLRLAGTGGYSMFDDLESAYPWVLPKYEYQDMPSLITSVRKAILEPAERKVLELRPPSKATGTL